MKVEKENSAVRDTHAGRLFAEGARMEKERVLASLPRRFADLHREAIIHIHDLDGWNDVGNCLTPKPESFLRPGEVRSVSVYGKIAGLFAQFGSMIGTVGHRQTGGIGCGNFDSDMAGAMRELGVEATSETALAFREEAMRFFSRLSTERLRNACENFYVTLNFGLDTSELGRLVSRESLTAFASLPADYTRPNLVFKVKKEINGEESLSVRGRGVGNLGGGRCGRHLPAGYVFSRLHWTFRGIGDSRPRMSSPRRIGDEGRAGDSRTHAWTRHRVRR